MKLFIVLIGIVTLVASCNSEEKKDKKETTTNVESQNSGDLKIAYYNLDSLKTMYTYYKEQDSILVVKGKSFQSELSRREKSLQGYISSKDAQAQQGLLSQNDIAVIQQTIQQRQNSLMSYQQSEGGKLENETMDILETIGNRLDAYGKKFSEENGIDILMVYSKGGQINYISSAMDVTESFTNYLNEQSTDLEVDSTEE
ncbi:MAG TPA: OmpH family outer membrane protein [Crocinitomicaceae bacterium]|nr:OmpH family outer membrane protein [Crocinitomicaceae bacterium]